MSNVKRHPASFKDPSGFVFKKDTLFYRQVTQEYASDYNLLMSSGLYEKLINKKYLLPHTEINENFTGDEQWYKTILPEQLSFISYPYEWCFEQLKDAALLTLAIQKVAIKHGMILKDANFFNIQFHKSSPVFIDTLSFEKYNAGVPWVAYRQFCECFLFPLLLQKYLKTDVQKLLLHYTEGIPVDVTKKLLPSKSKFNMGVWLHVMLQSKIKSGNAKVTRENKFDQNKMMHLITNLEDIIKGSQLNEKTKTTWSNYYDETIISKDYLAEKEIVFRNIINSASYKNVLDIGANDGYFSKIISEKATSVVSIDFDSWCINHLYKYVRKNQLTNILPLCIDYSNPTPPTGFDNVERGSFIERADFDLLLALALVHHLAISKNIPLETLAASFQKIAKTIIIEFVSKEDMKVQQLLQNRKDIYTEYDEAGFENAFGLYFTIAVKTRIAGTHRTMYLLKSK